MDLAQTIVNTAKVEVDFMRYSGESVGTGFIKAKNQEPEKLPDGVVRVVQHRLR